MEMPLNLGYVLSSYGIWAGLFVGYGIWIQRKMSRARRQLQEVKEVNEIST